MRAPQPSARQPWQEPWLRTILRCPVEGAELDDVTAPDGSVMLACREPHEGVGRVAYPVTGGVPVLLADDAVPMPGGS